MDVANDHFALFGLVPGFAIDMAALEQRYRDMQAESHPDRFAHAGEAEQRRAAQWSARINEAYKVLRNPFERACYLLERQGIHVLDPANTRLAPEFLIRQMEWREALGDAVQAGDQSALGVLESTTRREAGQALARIGQLLDGDKDYPQAAEALRQYRFLEKFLADINDAYEEMS